MKARHVAAILAAALLAIGLGRWLWPPPALPVEDLERDLYAVRWPGCGAPEAVAAGEEFLALARLENASPYPWPHAGNARVRLAFRWLGPAGEVLDREPAGPAQLNREPVDHESVDHEGVDHEDVRTDLAAPLAPGAALARWLRVRAPEVPGRYLLELDPVFEPFAFFSERGAETCRVAVEVR